MLKFVCIEEPVRTSNQRLTTWRPPFEAQAGSEASLKEIIRRADYVRAPSQATPVPTGSACFGTSDELFVRLQQAITGEAFLTDDQSEPFADFLDDQHLVRREPAYRASACDRRTGI